MRFEVGATICRSFRMYLVFDGISELGYTFGSDKIVSACMESPIYHSLVCRVPAFFLRCPVPGQKLNEKHALRRKENSIR